jgi:hypothetical protein
LSTGRRERHILVRNETAIDLDSSALGLGVKMRHGFAALTLAVAIAVAGGLAAYFATRGGATQPSVPKRWQNPVLEQAKERGIISDYRFVQVVPGTSLRYAVNDGQIRLAYFGCVGGVSCPATLTTLRITYQETAIDTARAVWKIARSQHPAMNIILGGSPYY